MHRLLKVDGVENLDGVAMLQKGVDALNHDAAFRERSVKIEMCIRDRSRYAWIPYPENPPAYDQTGLMP